MKRDKRLSSIKPIDHFVNKPLYSIDDELHALIFDHDTINISKENMILLKNAYQASKLRSIEYMNVNVPMNLRLHCQQASRIYNSITALIFAHLTIAKSEEIERYIKIKGSQLPSSVLNIKDWEDVLVLAKDFRESSSIPHQGLFELQQSTDLRLWIAMQASKKTRQDLIETKKEMRMHVDKIQEEMNNFVGSVTPAIIAFEKMTSSKVIVYQKENDSLKETISRYDADICVLKLQKETLEEEYAAANKNIEKHQSEIQALVDMINQRNAEITRIKKQFISPEENARMMESSLATIEDCHISTISKLYKSASLADYHAVIKARNDMKSSSEDIILPTASDIATRCEIVDQAYKSHIQAIEFAKDQIISSINQDLAKLDDDYKCFIQKSAATSAAFEAEIAQLSTKYSQLESDHLRMTTLQKLTEEELNQSRSSNQELSTKLLTAESDMKALETKISDQLEELKVAKNKHREDVDALESYVAKLRQENEDQARKLSELEVTASTNELKLKLTEDQLNQSNILNEKLSTKLTSAHTTIEILETKVKESETMLQQFSSKHKDDIATLEFSVNNLQQINKDQDAKLLDREATIADLEMKMRELEAKLEDEIQRNMAAQAIVKEESSKYIQTDCAQVLTSETQTMTDTSVQQIDDNETLSQEQIEQSSQQFQEVVPERVGIDGDYVETLVTTIINTALANSKSFTLSKRSIDIIDITGPRRGSIPQALMYTDSYIHSRILNEFSDLSEEAMFASDTISSQRSSFVQNNYIDLSNIEEKRDGIIKLQARIRGFLDRSHIRDMLLQQAAREKGLLVAYPGTKQGDAGWYVEKDSLYYFCLDEGEFTLFCGPISENIFQLALRELDHSYDHKLRPSSVYAKNISIDLVAMQVVKMQMEALKGEIKDRDHELNILREQSEKRRDAESSQVDSSIQTDSMDIQAKQSPQNQDAFTTMETIPESSDITIKTIENVDEVSEYVEADLQDGSRSVSIGLNTTPSKYSDTYA